MSTLLAWSLGYLVNSLWQVPLVFCAAWIAVRLMRRAGNGVEHRLWAGALLLQVLLPALSFHWSDVAALFASLGHWAMGGAAIGRTQVLMGSASVAGEGALRLPTPLIDALGVSYGLCVVFCAARLAWGLSRTHAIRRQAKPLPLAGVLLDAYGCCRARFAMGDRPVEILESPATASPVTFGLRTPALLLPPGFVRSVNNEDLRAALAHECAHIQRADFLKNILYGIVSLPLAYHPVLWLTRARLAESRELL